MSFERIEPIMGKAERGFRDALARLKTGMPERLAKGTPVSQNNVAKEAGKNPSALRKERFPSLVREIQVFVEHQSKAPTSERKKLKASRDSVVRVKEQLALVTAERDSLRSEAESMRVALLEQWHTIQRLQAGAHDNNVLSFDKE